jgi:uncharacterized membrane protein YqaE (UPF0057 family)
MCGVDVFLAILAIFFPPVSGKSPTSPSYSRLFPLASFPPLSDTMGYFSWDFTLILPLQSVWVKRGICTADSIINIALCCLGYVPGLLHAWYIILKYPDADCDELDREGYEPLNGPRRRQDEEGGRVTYYYVSHQPLGSHRPEERNYGVFTAPQSHPPNVPSPATRPAPPAQQPAAGSSSAPPEDTIPPPTYSEAVKEDHKAQTQS